MVVINNIRDGFFSNIFLIINHMSKAYLINDEIKVKNFSKLYSVFSDYFIEIKNNKKYNSKTFENIENYYSYKNYDVSDVVFNVELRNYIHFLIHNYLEINNTINKKIEYELKKFENKKVLGIHIRQTDHNVHGISLKFEDYIKNINKYKDNFDNIYVMSDNNEYINRLKQIYSNIITCDDIIRSNKYTDTPPHYDMNMEKYKKGEDVLIETIVLSNCDMLLLTSSNISSFVTCYNTKCRFKYMDLGVEY